MKKIKDLHLKYLPEDFEKMKKKKEKLGLTWEDFVFQGAAQL